MFKMILNVRPKIMNVYKETWENTLRHYERQGQLVILFVCFLIFGFDKNLEAQETKANVDIELHQIKLFEYHRKNYIIYKVHRQIGEQKYLRGMHLTKVTTQNVSKSQQKIHQNWTIPVRLHSQRRHTIKQLYKK